MVKFPNSLLVSNLKYFFIKYFFNLYQFLDFFEKFLINIYKTINYFLIKEINISIIEYSILDLDQIIIIIIIYNITNLFLLFIKLLNFFSNNILSKIKLK